MEEISPLLTTTKTQRLHAVVCVCLPLIVRTSLDDTFLNSLSPSLGGQKESTSIEKSPRNPRLLRGSQRILDGHRDDDDDGK